MVPSQCFHGPFWLSAHSSASPIPSPSPSPHPKPKYCDSKLVHVSVQSISPSTAQHPKSASGSLIPFLVIVRAVTRPWLNPACMNGQQGPHTLPLSTASLRLRTASTTLCLLQKWLSCHSLTILGTFQCSLCPQCSRHPSMPSQNSSIHGSATSWQGWAMGSKRRGLDG